MFETTVQRALIRGRSPATIVRPRPLGPPQPEVTVVVPCYNYGRYLEQAVASARSQDNVVAHVMIIDDASTDDSAEVAQAIAASDDKVSVIAHSTNKGHIATYNEGLGSVETEFVALLSADDLLTPGALGRATALMRSFPDVGFVYGRPVLVTGSVLPPARTRARTWTVWNGRDWIADRYRLGRNAIWAPESVMRTTTLHRAGLFDSAHPHSGDLHLWLRMAQKGDVGLISGADQGWYREHPSSMSRTRFSGQLTDLAARSRTFREAAASMPNGDVLYRQASLALAREALRTASAARSAGEGGPDDVHDLIDFARSTWPDAEQLPEARFLRAEMSAHALPPVPAAAQAVRRLLRDIRGDVRHRVRTWRSHVTGV